VAERRQRWALLLSVALHALALAWLAGWTPRLPSPQPETVTYMVDVPPPKPPADTPVATPPPAAPQALAPPPISEPTPQAPDAPAEPAPASPDKPRASRDAPAPPSAEDWAQASTYTLKNGKRYRYNWGLQLRSLMGTAVEGESNGVVRFRVTIAPDGSLALLETLWATSAATERLARQAIERMPPLPPTPGGAPLVFERTIAFDPWSDEMPPIYKDDCLPDPPQLRNPYVWDGRSPQGPAVQPVAEKIDEQAYAECLKQLPQDTVEAEAAHNERQIKRWASPDMAPTRP
jgi:hypothetical protein